jgi:hypothetical protein
MPVHRSSNVVYPMQVQELWGTTAVAASSPHSLAVRSEGTYGFRCGADC